MVRVLQPHTIIVYGSANYECFNKLKALGINIVAFPSQTSIAFEREESTIVKAEADCSVVQKVLDTMEGKKKDNLTVRVLTKQLKL